MITETKLDLACGNNKRDGYAGIDIVKTDSTDYVWDLQQYPWPIESESVEEINCSHYIEHIKHDNNMLELKSILASCSSFEEFKSKLVDEDYNKPQDGLIKFFNELYRVLKPGGKVHIVAPYYSSIRAVGDPTHVRLIGDSTFWYVNKKWREDNHLEHYGLMCDFEAKLSYYISNDMTLKSEEFRQNAFVHYLNAIEDIMVDLTKTK